MIAGARCSSGYSTRVLPEHGRDDDSAQRVHYLAVEANRVDYLISVHVGRSFRRDLRILDAVQRATKYQMATLPARNDAVVLPFISNEEAERKFASGVGLSKACS